ncbi:MAG: ATP-binding protein [Candidatus Omnitrophica bacterium]|nr:ATP-binding protein [Candidatus Omnitrophota bacterium]
MAKAEQIKSLIKSHLDNDRDRFLTIALQVAAHEARKGHSELASDIRSMVDKSKITPIKITSFKQGLDELIATSEPDIRLSELVAPKELLNRIGRILKEYRQQETLKRHGLFNRRKVLLAGPPGTGKTMTASVIATELHLPCFIIQMDKIVTKFMGETSAKLRQIFDIIQQHRGVFLFDEFDAIGGERGLGNDVGEMRRVLNSFLQFLENDHSESIIIAATNNPRLLDQALFRRFDDILYYNHPTPDEAEFLIDNRLGNFKGNFSLKSVSEKLKGLSHAEITQACNDAIKETILSDRNKVTKQLLLTMLQDRKAAYL